MFFAQYADVSWIVCAAQGEIRRGRRDVDAGNGHVFLHTRKTDVGKNNLPMADLVRFLARGDAVEGIPKGYTWRFLPMHPGKAQSRRLIPDVHLPTP